MIKLLTSRSGAWILVGEIMFCVILGWFLQPAEVVAVHNEGDYSEVLVRHFPVTDKGKINWWYRNELFLKSHYKMPNPGKDSLYEITFWDFGEGYKEDDEYDRLCFDDMKTKLHCIDKNYLFTVENDRHGNLLFSVNDGTYHTNKKGKLVKQKYEINAY